MAIRRRSFWKSGIGIACGLSLGLVALPILLPIATISCWRSQNLLRRLVDKVVCALCGVYLGPESLRIAEQRGMQKMQSMEGRLLARRGRTIRDLHVVCPTCDCEYTYCERENSLVRRGEV